MIDMENVELFNEYYDELFPVSEDIKEFYLEITKKYKMPTRFLRIASNTGGLEYHLALEGHDVTGLEEELSLLESASRRRRYPNTALRFLNMSGLEMTHFLGEGFYNVISVLYNQLLFIHDEILIKKFFFDCKKLLSQDGSLVLHLWNLEGREPSPMLAMPTIESERAKLFYQIWQETERFSLNMDIERSNGKVFPVLTKTEIQLYRPIDIKRLAEEAGFQSIAFYADFQKNPFTKESEMLLAVLS